MNRGVPLEKTTLGQTVSHGGSTEALTANQLASLENLRQPFWLVSGINGLQLEVLSQLNAPPPSCQGMVPGLLPAQLGDQTFIKEHGLSYAYMAGAMANGIGSTDIVIAMGRAGMLGSFGAAGLDPARVEQAIRTIQTALPQEPYAINLIHAPSETAWEEKVVDHLICHQVRLVEASAYLNLSPAIVRYRTHGIHQDASGRVVTPNKVIAKVSRIEVASKFLAPPPEKILQDLLAQGHLSEEQVALARTIPMAQDLSAEADSGGHTDNRPALALLPTMQACAMRFQKEYPNYPHLRVGLGGGISTPASAAAAFSMGAAFILTGSVNQACQEAGTSDIVRDMLAQTKQADITMAPAADMFEMGVKLQVLKRGTMFAMRANKLYEFYRTNTSVEALPPQDKAWLEKTIFRAPLEDIWQQTTEFFLHRDPRQIERANRDPKHKMALLFRWYLGKSSIWANKGEQERKIDFQVWCGPSMGAFNEWTANTWLAQAENRRVVPVAQNILYGAAVLTRQQMARQQGLSIPVNNPQPKLTDDLKEYFS